MLPLRFQDGSSPFVGGLSLSLAGMHVVMVRDVAQFENGHFVFVRVMSLFHDRLDRLLDLDHGTARSMAFWRVLSRFLAILRWKTLRPRRLLRR